MAKLSDVQNSLSGEGATKQKDFTSYAGALMGEPPAKNELAYVVFKLVRKKRGRTYIDGICDNAYNEKTKKRERIYLLQGAESIWQSDLRELLKDKEYVGRNRRSLLFEDGVCRIKKDDDRALEYARTNTKNVGRERKGSGKFDFFEYNPAIEQQEKLNAQLQRIKTVTKVQELEEEAMRKLASFLNISFVDEWGMAKLEEGIRSELLVFTDNDHATVLKYIDSAEVNIAYLVKKAIISAKIDLTEGNAAWAGGKGFICKIPAASKPYPYLTELAMTNSEAGRQFKEQLEAISK